MKQAIGVVGLLVVSVFTTFAQANISSPQRVNTDKKVTVTLVRWPYT